MASQTQTQYNRNIRTAYMALDSLQSLVDRGLTSSDRIAKAMGAVREVINEIEGTPIRTRKSKSA